MITKQQKIDMVHGLLFKNCTDRSEFYNKSTLNINKVSEYIVENIETLITLICEKNDDVLSNTVKYEREHIEPSKPWPKPVKNTKIEQNKHVVETFDFPPPILRNIEEPQRQSSFEDWSVPLPKNKFI